MQSSCFGILIKNASKTFSLILVFFPSLKDFYNEIGKMLKILCLCVLNDCVLTWFCYELYRPFVCHYKECVCVRPSTLFPWCKVAVWLVNVHKPNSLRVTDCRLYFSFLSPWLTGGVTNSPAGQREAALGGEVGWHRRKNRQRWWRCLSYC